MIPLSAFSRRSFLLTTLALLISLLLMPSQAAIGAQPQAPAATVRYVNAAATGNGNGTSWANAFTKVQDALAAAVAGDEIWIAAGVYTPNTANTTIDLKNGVALYGGFAGTESQRDQRNWQTHRTILSGDVDGNDFNSDGNFISEGVGHIQGTNAGRIVVSNGIDRTARLDGVILTGAAVDGAIILDNSSPTLVNLTIIGNQAQGGNDGGGIRISNGSPLLNNVRIVNNTAFRGGGIHSFNNSNPILLNVTLQGNVSEGGAGGMNSATSSATLINVSFVGNRAGGEGAGMNNDKSNATLVNVIFVGNSTTAAQGGGMANVNGGTITLTNVTFVDNGSNDNGGGMYTYNSEPTLRNTIFWNNDGTDRVNQINGSTGSIQHSLIQGDNTTDNGNLDGTVTQPGFVRLPNGNDYGDLRLRTDSALQDKGNNSFLPADTQDLDGDGDTTETLPLDLTLNPRIEAGTVDLGAYEFGLPYRTFVPMARK